MLLKGLAIAAAAALAACTTPVTTYHNVCMEGHAAFLRQFDCIRANVMNDPGLRDDPLVQEYILTGEMLARQRQAGRIGEDQARLQFLQKLNEIRARQLDMMADQALIHGWYDRLWPRYTDCVRHGDNLHCTTW